MSVDDSILEDFRQESMGLMSELNVLIEKIEVAKGAVPSALFDEFAQCIDRVMGAAQTISTLDPTHRGLDRISKLAELCKWLGIKAKEMSDPAMVPIFAAFFADVVEVIERLLMALSDTAKTEQLTKSFSAVLQKRLEWLASKMIASGVAAEGTGLDAEKLLKRLGF